MTLPPAARKSLLTLAALAVWSFVFWRATLTFTPRNDDNDVTFNSDSAIAVLMANDDRPITVFNAYYYCADRWGGWPFLIAQGIRRATGFTWTDHSVFVMQALWVLLGAWACAALCRRDWAIAGLAYLLSVCVLPGGRFLLFELSQIYGWQVTGTLFAWLGIRRVFDSLTRPDRASGAAGAAARWSLCALVFTFLAVWSSVASLPILIVLGAIEGVRAWAGRAVSGATGSPDSADSPDLPGLPSRATWRALAIGSALSVAAVAGGAFLEWLLKARYHRYSLEHYGLDYSTTFHIDHGHLLNSLGIQTMHLVRQPLAPLYALPIVALVVVFVLFVYALATKRRTLWLAVTRVAADSTAMTIAGCVAISALTFTLAVLVDHVRLNNYDTRYLTLTNTFLPMGGMLTGYLLARMAARTASRQAFVQPAAATAAIVLLIAMIPAPRPSMLYGLQVLTARELAARRPRGVLMGGYWETYIFTALQPPERAMIPVTFNGSRTPWTAAAVKPAREVIVAYPKHGARDSVTMPETIPFYDVTLRLEDPHWLENQAYQFGRYVNTMYTNTTPAPSATPSPR